MTRRHAHRAVLDADRCIGCGECSAIAPTVFHLDPSTGLCEVHRAVRLPVARVEAAIHACPTDAIRWG